ncbi:MAG: hypothetical protein QXG12_04435 [Thermoproteota archaeon]
MYILLDRLSNVLKLSIGFKGISTVLATLIIVALTITVAIAFTFWFGGLTGVFMGWERLEVSNAVASRVENGWRITFTVVNRGVWDSRFTGILVNDKPIEAYAGRILLLDENGSPFEDVDIPIKAGSTVTVTLYVEANDFHPGQTISIIFQSARGGSFPREVYLP